MNIYKVDLNKWDYDEYDSFVVYADSATSAVDVVMQEVNPHYLPSGQMVEVVELLGHTTNLDTSPDSGIILGSFNAG